VALIFRATWPRDRMSILHIAIAGVLMQAAYLGGVFMSIHLGLPAAVTALVVGLQPIITALLAGWWLRERVSRYQWIGLALGFCGVALVVTHGRVGLNSDWPTIALLPAAVSLISITLGTLYQKRFCPSFDLRSGAVIQFAASALVTLPIAAGTETLHIEWSTQFIFALSWLVFMLSIGAISVLNVLIRRGTAVRVTSLFYLTPAVTALMAWALFGETMQMPAIAGLAIAALGVWLARR
ncbi:MAG TPA: DMT family transporter, partial [Rhodocyclaceae bacterium]|nr:DMT family transporter [Rhodocyclaceae bacterium]